MTTSIRPAVRRVLLAIFMIVVALSAGVDANAQTDPLPSWNDGAAKSAIIDFVEAATTAGGPHLVAPADRVATFDQDGTTWVEQPLYGQGLFALDRLAALAPDHPEWKETMPFQAVLAGDHAAMANFSEKDWMEIVAVTHAGMSTADFDQLVADWTPRSRNPVFGLPVTELVYRPMLEVMDYLRDNGWRTYIVTGGGQEFVRVYAEDVYGIPPEQVVGSSIVTTFATVDGKPALMREPKVFFIDDGAGKAVGINLFIGKRPQIAFGNSNGDKEMLEWATGGDGRGLGLLVLHDDAEREFAYGPANGLPDSRVGTFSQALMDTARQNGWTVISMKDDWKTHLRPRPSQTEVEATIVARGTSDDATGNDKRGRRSDAVHPRRTVRDGLGCALPGGAPGPRSGRRRILAGRDDGHQRGACGVRGRRQRPASTRGSRRFASRAASSRVARSLCAPNYCRRYRTAARHARIRVIASCGREWRPSGSTLLGSNWHNR